MSLFRQAVKSEAKLRLAIAGASGTGKTMSSLLIAHSLANGGQVAVIDTENGSASKYADVAPFDVAEMHAPYAPTKFVQAIEEAGKAGYAVLIIDSLSHAWNGPGGILEIVDMASKKYNGNSYYAWREGTPLQQQLIDAIVTAPMHIIATMRAKEEYAETVENGRKTYRKVGTSPIQRDGVTYEFDVAFDMDIDNNAIVSKTRCPALTGKVFKRPGADVAGILRDWLSGDKPEPPAPAPQTKTKAQPKKRAPVSHPQTEVEDSRPETWGHPPDGALLPPTDEDFYDNGDATDNPFDDVPAADNPPVRVWEAAYMALDGQCLNTVDKMRQAHADSAGPHEQHGWLCGVIDKICKQDAHRDVLSVFVGREVTSENPEGEKLGKALLKVLLDKIAVKDEHGQSVKGDDGKVVYKDNPDYRKDVVACVQRVWALALEARGQMQLVAE